MLPPEDHRAEAPAAAPVARRLLIRPGAIGDTLVWLPAAAHLRPAEIWVPTANLPLVRHLAPARAIASTGLELAGLPGYEVPAALSDFDEIWSWYGANRDDFRAAVAHLPFRFFRALPDGNGHAVDFYAAQTGAPPSLIPRLPVERHNSGFAVIHPFSSSPRKNWPLEKFAAVAQALQNDGVEVRFTAGPDEPLDGAVRFDDLGRLAEWLAQASIYIGNDSGITHLAAACGVPVVALFGPASPRAWTPRGSRVRVLSLDDSAERVSSAAREIIERM